MSREWRWRLARFCVRLAVICLVAGLVLLLPEPEHDGILRYKNVLTVLMAIITGGKVLVDSFFFDRYPY